MSAKRTETRPVNFVLAPFPMTINASMKLVTDIALFMLATVAAFALRYDGVVPAAAPVLIALGFSLPLKILMEFVLGLPARSWSSLTFRDLGALLALSVVVAVPMRIFAPGKWSDHCGPTTIVGRHETAQPCG